jgi:hypothetical protein
MYTKTLICLGFLALSPALAQAGPGDFGGKLYRLGSQKQELLFTLQATRGGALWVDHYKDAQGGDAVIERVAFEEDRPVSYEFDDRQQGGLGKVQVQGQELLLSWTQDGKTKEKRVPAPKTLILGPLYADLLRQRWDPLMAGEAIVGTVPVLSRDRLMTATLAFKRSPAQDKGDGTLCVVMKPANWFVALFFPPINLHFDPATKRLANVQGMSLLKEKIKGKWEMTEVDLDYN